MSYEILNVVVGTAPAGLQEMPLRSFRLNASEHNLDAMNMATDNRSNMTVDALNQSELISMSTDASRLIDLGNGSRWGDERQVMYMIVRNIQTGTIHFLSGWAGPDLWNGQYNLQANITFNLAGEFHPTHMGGEMVYRPSGCDNILGSVNLDYRSNESAVASRLRPFDMIQAASVMNQFEGNPTAFCDTGSMGSALSQTRNSDGVSYLGRSLMAMQSASMAEVFEGGFTPNVDDICNYAMSKPTITERRVTSTEVLGEILGSFDQRNDVTVSLGHLVQKYPGLNQMMGPPIMAGVPAGIELANWQDRNAAMGIAELANALPAMIMEKGMLGFGFEISNNQTDPMNGMPNTYSVIPEECAPLVPCLDEGYVLNSLMYEIRERLFPRISAGHSMTITCSCSIVSEMNIVVVYNGRQYAFKAPTWASSLWAAVNGQFSENKAMVTGMYGLANYLAKSNDGFIDTPGTWAGNSTPGNGSDFA